MIHCFLESGTYYYLILVRSLEVFEEIVELVVVREELNLGKGLLEIVGNALFHDI